MVGVFDEESTDVVDGGVDVAGDGGDEDADRPQAMATRDLYK